MEDYVILVFCFLVFTLHMSESLSVNTISANIAIKDGDTMVSDGDMFELGFFSPKNTKNRYLGIWYKKIATGTVVWVANRETPVTDNSGVFKVTRNGTLQILNGNSSQIWSSYSSMESKQNPRNPRIYPVVRLLDSGNLVLWGDEESSKTGNTISAIWQSFDYPGNTQLAGMKIGVDLVTGFNRCLTSWKTPDDPSSGSYKYLVDINGYPQLVQRHGSVLHSRLGPWNGIKFHGTPIREPNPFYSHKFVVNSKEIFARYELKNSVVMRVVTNSDGATVLLQWIDRNQEWIIYGNIAIDTCGGFGFCGPFGRCSITRYPPCSCMDGFVPKRPEEWDAADWSSGCKRKEPLSCDQDGFKKFSGLKFPDTRRSKYNYTMTFGECETACRKNCDCTAYSHLDVRNGGSGCLLWIGELMDIREYDEDQYIYIKMAASKIIDGSEKKRILGILLAISSATFLLSTVVYAYRNKKKRPQIKGKRVVDTRDKSNRGGRIEVVDDLSFFSLNKIAKATNNFSINNIIGEGGFGVVYKGVLEDGREVAVKRLSETSQQGIEEFKNEVMCIAKLQHRNLVKLLGYCIHGNEMILIYEYMANKSLDSLIFDDSKSSILDWPQRLRIIHGMARGILYLHQDSRFQIIHRDLKAGNILLDDEMNPKISDFGLARKFVGFDNAAKTKKVVGTYGYISPEYAVHGRFSVKSDVFSFGVLLLEIVSGKKNREFSHEDHRDNLLGHAWRLFKEDKSTELMSPSLRESCNLSQVKRSIHVGLLCVQHHAEDRPTMLSVVLMLVSEGELPTPNQPAFFTQENRKEHESLQSVNDYMITLLYAR